MSTAAGILEFVSEPELLDFVVGRRWFGSKDRDATSLTVLDEIELSTGEERLFAVLVEIRYGSGSHTIYQLLLGVREGQEGDQAIGSARKRIAVEAFGDPGFSNELEALMRSGASPEGAHGTVVFESSGSVTMEPPAVDDIRLVGVEQSNSSLVIGDRLIVKAYRQIGAGTNPELELLQFLGRNGFENAPPLKGWWSYTGPALNATLGVAQRFVPGAVDGWSLAMKELPAEEETFLDRLERLGEVIGAMHTILASDSEDPAFAPELLGPETLSLLVATMDDEIDALFLRLPENEVLAPIAGCREAIRDVLLGLPSVGSTGQLIRCHGDLHLGQVLWAQDDWFVVDFEGEPSRSLNERRRKRSPLRDVAGMLRSFSYAASAKDELSATFEEAARARFLAGYESTALGSALAAPSGEATAYLIRVFELEKALYELRYELENRPDWIAVPVAGIVRLLEQAHA